MLFSYGHGQTILIAPDGKTGKSDAMTQMRAVRAVAPGAKIGSVAEGGIEAGLSGTDIQSFGYMFPDGTGVSGDDAATVDALKDLASAMVEATGDPADADSAIPPVMTYLGQFIDHDITFDPFSELECGQDPYKTHNFRSPSLDLDNLYGDGPALNPFMYEPDGNKLLLGTNRAVGPPNPPNPFTPTDWDVPRNPDGVAIIGDPRNNENLVVSQLQQAMIRFHNKVVDHLQAAGTPPDALFAKAKQMTTHHYQWMVVHDFLPRICDPRIVNDVFTRGLRFFRRNPFVMPVEFAIAAYRFGHSMVRDQYAVNARFPNQDMSDIFAFANDPNLLPVFSNWVIDFNLFFETGSMLPVQMAKKIDTRLAQELSSLPGQAGIMAVLAARNLQRGLVFNLPCGQCISRRMRVRPLTPDQLLEGDPAQADILREAGDQLLKETPLWYYVLKEAQVRHGGEHLGAVGSRIVAEVFFRILKQDPDSYLNANGFQPSLPAANPGTFNMPDLLDFAGALLPAP